MERKSILIIHRDDNTRKEMHDILSHFDFNLLYADDGLHGLYGARSAEPDLIVSAVNIAVLNGMEMCRMIRHDSDIGHTPIILLHNELNLDHIKKARTIGVSAFLIKPYLDNSLIYAIKRALREDDLHINSDHAPLCYENCKIPVLSRVQYA